MSPKGFSFFYPTLPIFSFIAIILMALLFPGFYRTRSIALMSLWTWVYFLNLFTCINMILWRSSVDDLAPVYCDIVATFMASTLIGVPASILCLSRFVWQLSHPSPVLQIYKNHRNNLIIDASVCIGLPLILIPTRLVTFSSRYTIIEDLGCNGNVAQNIGTLLIYDVFRILMGFVGSIYTSVAIRNFLRNRRRRKESIENGHDEEATGMSYDRYVRLVIFSSLTMVSYNSTYIFIIVSELIHGISPVPNWATQRHIITTVEIWSRATIDQLPLTIRLPWILLTFNCPAMAFMIFSFLGVGTEAMKGYKESINAIKDIFTWRRTKWETHGPDWEIMSSTGDQHQSGTSVPLNSSVSTVPLNASAFRLPQQKYPSMHALTPSSSAPFVGSIPTPPPYPPPPTNKRDVLPQRY